MSIVRALTRSRCGPYSARVLGVPYGGESPFVGPQCSCEHAVVFAHLSILARVANECTHVIDSDAVPLINLCLGWFLVICEGLVTIEHFTDASDRVDARAHSGIECGICHLQGVVNSAIPFGFFPLNPPDAVWVVGGD